MRLVPILVLLLSTAASGEERPLWMAIGSQELLEALEPLAAHRRAEGFEVVLANPPLGPPRRPAFLLLVGDDHEGALEAPWPMPAPRRELYRWRREQRETFAADAVLGDEDGDLLPDFPVGRIPARTAAEVARVVEKTLAYEGREPAPEDLRLLAWAGAPGYGGFIDSMATGLLVTTVKTHAPRWVDPWMISASSASALCGWPPDHPDRFARELRKGCLLGAIVAHADEDFVFSMRHGNRYVLFGAPQAAAHLGKGPPAPPLVVLTCESGRFDGREKPCMAEALLQLPGGPVAVIAATTQSHPLPNFYTGRSLLRTLADREDPRLGTIWLQTQRDARKAADPLMERMLRDVEGKLEDAIDVDSLQRDQVLLYAYLGDPALALKLPGRLEATVERTAAGWRWEVPKAAGLETLEIAWKPPAPPSLPRRAADADAETARALFEQANASRAFTPHDAGEAWEGVAKKPGWLRLVARGPGTCRLAVLELKD